MEYEDVMYDEDQMQLEINKRRKEVETKIMKRLAYIVKQPINSLSVDDIKYLRARSSYLSNAQRQEYDEIINGKKEVVVQEKPLNKMNRKELEAKALEVGIDKPEDQELFPSKNELIKAIEA